MGGSYAALEGPAVAMAQRDDHELVVRNTRWVMDAARSGAVIVGRNGTQILATWPGALHVRLDAAVQWRVERAARTSGITPDRAAKRQRREDALRADMSIRLYGWDPRQPTRYDLVLNTGTLTVDACVEIVVHASRVKAARSAPTA
jgi:cytidylate kinase